DGVMRHRRVHAEILVAHATQGGDGMRGVVDVEEDAHHALIALRRAGQHLVDHVPNRLDHDAFLPRIGATSVSLISATENAGSSRMKIRKNMPNQANEAAR